MDSIQSCSINTEVSSWTLNFSTLRFTGHLYCAFGLPLVCYKSRLDARPERAKTELSPCSHFYPAHYLCRNHTMLVWPVLCNPANVKKRLFFFERREPWPWWQKNYILFLKKELLNTSLCFCDVQRGECGTDLSFQAEPWVGTGKQTNTVLGKREDRWGPFGHTHTLLPSYLKFLWCALVAPSKSNRKSLTHSKERKTPLQESRLKGEIIALRELGPT